ncbi:hypothetical protein JR316_0012134 [Psilocybe cubensis]|uniref:Uncharacterized protein n=2 Tax=Psilocybe cubensis TaxID=181762 RepID=A0A8H7XRG1_PSICU|nr:hypothetical protein JR316_0012134 [Psilocybe cubensis]KAH9475032.1 hypothetical protein JR316_0012134 [Psilocybe cubensis]
MNTSFTFPKPQAAVPRQQLPRPAGSSQPNARESNALRASVLDAALELGIGSNSLVTDWMFNNPLAEEDEEEDHTSSPSLTYGSSATSEESSSSALTPSSSTSSSKFSGAGAPSNYAKPAPRLDGMLRINESESESASPSTGFDSSFASSNTMAFPDIPVPPQPVIPAPRKLKKKHRGDGYESDGGYISEAAGKKEKKKVDAIAFPSMETPKEAKKRAKEAKKEIPEGGERKKKKSLISAVKSSKKSESKDGEKGYDTDGGGILSSGKKGKDKKSKSKVPSEDITGGYETDGAVKKSKTRFFKLSNKASRPDLRTEAVPAMPMPPIPKEVVPLPIAERFATTLGNPTTAENSTTNPPLALLSSSTSGKAEGSSTPLPPLAFQSFAPPSPISAEVVPLSRVIPPSPIAPVGDRTSHSSSESSSSNSRRQAGQFSPPPSSSGHGHGHGSGSHSTLTSNHTTERPFSPVNGTIPSPPNSAGVSSGPNHLKPPSISYPNTRSLSPLPSRGVSPMNSPPVSPLHIAKGGLRVRPSLENMGYTSRENSVSPMPISPISPMMSTPLRSAVSSPTLGLPPQPYASSGVPGSPTSRLRSRSPVGLPTSPSLNTFISHPITAVDQSQLTVNSQEYSGPSHRNSGLPSPNVLAYYDIPPPSPPPMGPLPTLPAQASCSSNTTGSANTSAAGNLNPGGFPSAAVLRQRVIDRTPRQLPPDFLQTQANIQRGKESPFPSRPVPPSSPMPLTGTRRYRDLYPPGQVPPVAAVSPERVRRDRGFDDVDGPTERHARFRDELSWINTDTATGMPKERSQWQDDDDGDSDAEEVGAYDGVHEEDDDLDESAEDLKGVLDRFEGRRSEGSDRVLPERALGRSHSPEMLKGSNNDSSSKNSLDATSSTEADRDPLTPTGAYADSRTHAQGRSTVSTTADLMYNRESQYTFDDSLTVGDRMSRWSGSIYSRASMLDADASGETRERLVRQVEEMLAKEARRGGGGAKSDYIPPVPRIPDAYANANRSAHLKADDAGVLPDATPARSWNRF